MMTTDRVTATTHDTHVAKDAYPSLADLTPQAKLWLERDGKIALSGWRVALLEAIEASLGVRLIATRSGGSSGGGSHLTPAAHDFIRRWHTFSADLDAWVATHFRAAFGQP